MRTYRFALTAVALLASLPVGAQPPEKIPVLVPKPAPIKRVHGGTHPPYSEHYRAPGDFKGNAYRDSHGNWRITGTVSGVNVPSWTISVNDGRQEHSILIQHTTVFKNITGNLPGMLALNAGDRIRLEGLGLDDKRVVATSIRFLRDYPPSWAPAVDPAHPTPELFVSNIHNGSVVPPIFRLTGDAAKRASLRVTVRSTRPLLPGSNVSETNVFSVDGKADGRGHFDVSVRADNEPPGSKLVLEVQSGDEFGNRTGPLIFTVTRQ